MEESTATAGTSYRFLAIRMRKTFSFLRYLSLKRHTTGAAGARPAADSAQGHQPAGQAATASASACSVFVAGLPLGLHRSEVLTELFSTFGAVVNVAVHHKETSALVVFKSAGSVDALFEAADNGNILEFIPAPPQKPYGLKGWVEEHKHKYPQSDVMKQRIEAFWEDHQQEQARAKADREAAMTDDGWTLVTRHKGRKKNKDAGGTAVSGVAAAAAAEQANKESRTLDDFYRFQSREKRRDELLELRKKFQQDKKRIADLRAQRRFRPY